MIKKTFFLLLTPLITLYAMPSVIDDYEEKDIPQASANKMKDSLSPTKDILSKADEIYDKEQEDYKATVKLEKYRNLKSRNHTFLVDKKISLANILSEMTSLNKSTQTNKSIKLKREKKHEIQ